MRDPGLRFFGPGIVSRALAQATEGEQEEASVHERRLALRPDLAVLPGTLWVPQE